MNSRKIILDFMTWYNGDEHSRLPEGEKEIIDLYFETADQTESIHDLELFRCLVFDSVIVMRVPGGWIIETPQGIEGYNSVFVPYSDEFKIDKT